MEKIDYWKPTSQTRNPGLHNYEEARLWVWPPNTSLKRGGKKKSALELEGAPRSQNMSTLWEIEEKRHPKFKIKECFLYVWLEGGKKNQPMSSMALLKLLMIPALSSFGILSKDARAMLNERINPREKLEMFQCFQKNGGEKERKRRQEKLVIFSSWSMTSRAATSNPPLCASAFFSFSPQNHSSITFFPVSSKRARLVR